MPNTLSRIFNNPADPRERRIESLIVEESLALLNEGAPTHFHIQTNSLSTIDLSLCSVDAVRIFEHETDIELHGSDHFPMYIRSVEYLPQHSPPRWITGRANWEEYKRLADELHQIPDSSPLQFYDEVANKIREAAKATIPRSDGYYKLCPVPWWNNNCKHSKKERNRAQRQMTRLGTLASRVNYKRAKGVHQR